VDYGRFAEGVEIDGFLEPLVHDADIRQPGSLDVLAPIAEVLERSIEKHILELDDVRKGILFHLC
jgi:hypothetical protein